MISQASDSVHIEDSRPEAQHSRRIQTSSRVHLILSWARLLSGGLDDCITPDDDSCEAGVAAVAAYTRHYTEGEPHVVIPYADRQSPFVQMHPLGWSVNRLVLNRIVGWNVFMAPPSLLTQNSVDFEISQRDISDMQSQEMPLVLSNVAVPPFNSWYPYTESIHFDQSTGLAVISVSNSNEIMTVPQIPSVLGLLDYVYRVNSEAGCDDVGDVSAWEEYAGYIPNRVNQRCWIPVVVFADVQSKFSELVAATVEYKHPPALIVDVEGNSPIYIVPRRIGPQGTWLVSYESDDDEYFHKVLTLSEDGKKIDNVRLIKDDLENLDPGIKDEVYNNTLMALRAQADAASTNNPVVGQSTFMPLHREGSYRRCKAGECEIGNLFMDALLWWSKADVAFSASGGFRGTGWQAGGVRISNIWEALPFPNNPCIGKMNGVSLFRLFDYSINIATFEGENTSEGDRLLQVAGLKVTFNKGLEVDGEKSRIVSMHVWDKELEEYVPVERLKIYTFVTDSFMCSGFDPFPAFLRSDLTFDGEQPGETSDALLVQGVVADFLSSLDSQGLVYEAEITDRIVNDTSIEEALNLVQSAEDCEVGTYWDGAVSTCQLCPIPKNTIFRTSRIELAGIERAEEREYGSVTLVNGESYDVTIVPKANPNWLIYADSTVERTGESTPLKDEEGFPLLVGDRTDIGFEADMPNLSAGTAQGTVFFDIFPGETDEYLGCPGKEISFDVFVDVEPEADLNQLGGIRYVGWVLCASIVALAVYFASWVMLNRKMRIVKTLQPAFLVTICIGVAIMSLAIIPLSIDDGFASTRGCDVACMGAPWLGSLGFTVAMGALFSKLWRINKLFHSALIRRMKVSEKDVLAPFATMFVLNVALLLLWQILEPYRWQRLRVAPDESWNTFGTCRSNPDGNGTIATTLGSLVLLVNIAALLVACFQAYQARDISDEFSESKNMSVALFSWCQVFVVAFPMLFLIDAENPEAVFFLQSTIVFAVCVSMLLLIFVPLLRQANALKREIAARSQEDQQRPRMMQTTTSTDSQITSTVRASGRSPGVGTVHVSGLPNVDFKKDTTDSRANSEEASEGNHRQEDWDEALGNSHGKLDASNEVSKSKRFL